MDNSYQIPSSAKQLTQYSNQNGTQIYLVPQTLYSKAYIVKKVSIQGDEIRRENQRKYCNSQIAIMKILVNEPNIVQFLNFAKSKDSFYIEMEYCQGGNLGEYAKKNNYNVDIMIAARIFRQILYAMKSLHQNCVVHRDIKPANIYLTKNLTVKLGDFGVSWHQETNQLLKSQVYTPLYAAPQILSNQQYENCIDIYSIGTTIYQIIQGPFKDRQSETIFKRTKSLEAIDSITRMRNSKSNRISWLQLQNTGFAHLGATQNERSRLVENYCFYSQIDKLINKAKIYYKVTRNDEVIENNPEFFNRFKVTPDKNKSNRTPITFRNLQLKHIIYKIMAQGIQSTKQMRQKYQSFYLRERQFKKSQYNDIMTQWADINYWLQIKITKQYKCFKSQLEKIYTIHKFQQFCHHFLIQDKKQSKDQIQTNRVYQILNQISLYLFKTKLPNYLKQSQYSEINLNHQSALCTVSEIYQ